MAIQELAWSMGAVFAAAVLRGFTGFGFALAAVPLVSLLMPPAQAVTLALLLQFAGGLSDFSTEARRCHWPSLRWLMAGAAVGSPIGMLVLTSISPTAARVAIAGTVICAVVAVGAVRTVTTVVRTPASLGFGLGAGVLNGLAAMPGPPVITYYMLSPLEHGTVRASLLVFFLATSSLGLINALWFGTIDLGILLLALAALPAMWGGTWLGSRFFRNGTAQAYRRVAIACLVAICIVSAVPALKALA